MTKKKRALIVYFKNGNFNSQVKKEIIHSKVVSEFANEGREISRVIQTDNAKTTTFNDDSSVTTRTISNQLKGERFTHLYIDESIRELGISIDNVVSQFTPSFLPDNYENWETSGNRVFVFSVYGNQVNIKAH